MFEWLVGRPKYGNYTLSEQAWRLAGTGAAGVSLYNYGDALREEGVEAVPTLLSIWASDVVAREASRALYRNLNITGTGWQSGAAVGIGRLGSIALGVGAGVVVGEALRSSRLLKKSPVRP